MLYQFASEGECDSVLDYQTGVRANWVLWDAIQILTREDRSTPYEEFRRSVFVIRSRYVLSRSDPLPGLSYGLNGLWHNLT
jgi:hypothetical protein